MRAGLRSPSWPAITRFLSPSSRMKSWSRPSASGRHHAGVFRSGQRFVLRYRGRIDNGFIERLKRNSPGHPARPPSSPGRTALRSADPAGGHGAHRLPHCPRSESVAQGRQRHLSPRCAADLAEPLPDVPSSRRGRAVLADDLQAGGQLGRGHQELHAKEHDAAVEDHGKGPISTMTAA